MTISRRDFIHVAAAMGASRAWAGAEGASRSRWRERRALFRKASPRATRIRRA